MPTAQSIPSPSDLPSQFSFLFQVSELRADYSYHMPRTDGPPGNWLPPNAREDFRIRYGSIYRWVDGSVDAVYPAGKTPTDIRNIGIEEYFTASAFIQQQTEKVLAVPFNVAESNFMSSPHDWRTIGFHHLNPDNPRANSAALASYGGLRIKSFLDFTGEERLAASGSKAWVGEFLPAVYDYQSPAPNAPIPVSAGLCGKLPLILALLAFSCKPEMTDSVFCYSFGRGIYRPHRCPTGRM